jgi:hypothetical protein
MKICRSRVLLLLAVAAAALPLHAADVGEEQKLGWFNSTELSVVYASGNSDSHTYGLKETLRRLWDKARFKLRADYLRADTADDRYLLVASGITFLPGEHPSDPPTSVVQPPVEPDVEKIFVESVYGREIRQRFFWTAGASWDRNEDAGILNRYIGFGTLGNQWFKREDFSWNTTYGVSYTDRHEEHTEPGRNEEFFGMRLGSELRMKMGSVTSFENEFTGNASFADLDDYTLDMTSSVTVRMGKRVSLKVSLQYLFNNLPAFEEVDVIARVVLEDPDGVPGSGDEFFRTVSSGGSEITIGESPVHKEQLDTVFRTTLVIDF